MLWNFVLLFFRQCTTKRYDTNGGEGWTICFAPPLRILTSWLACYPHLPRNLSFLLFFTYQRLCVHHLSCDSLSNHVDRPFVIILFIYLILLKRWFWTVGIGPWPCTPKEETVSSRFFLARLKANTLAVEWCLIVSVNFDVSNNQNDKNKQQQQLH